MPSRGAKEWRIGWLPLGSEAEAAAAADGAATGGAQSQRSEVISGRNTKGRTVTVLPFSLRFAYLELFAGDNLFSRIPRRLLYRAAVFLCSVPLRTDLSRMEMQIW